MPLPTRMQRLAVFLFAGVCCLLTLSMHVHAHPHGPPPPPDQRPGDPFGSRAKDDDGDIGFSRRTIAKGYLRETEKRLREFSAGRARLAQLMADTEGAQSSDARRAAAKQVLNEVNDLERTLKSLKTRIGWIKRRSNMEFETDALYELEATLVKVRGDIVRGDPARRIMSDIEVMIELEARCQSDLRLQAERYIK